MLHVHRAGRADTLVQALGDLLAVPPADPFTPDVVGVPTRGMERWLTQSLALRVGTGGEGRRDGILANVEFPSPREIVGTAIAEAQGLDPARDPWTVDRLVWPLLEVVDAHLGEPWLAVLADHLRDSTGLGSGGRPRRLVAVRHLARLYDRYAVQRPAMLGRWAAGDDVDGSGAALPAHAAWQAALWRRLRERIDAPDPVARLQVATAAITADPGVIALPGRPALFGLTRLPAAHVDVLRAVATGRDVHLHVLHPSPALWSAVAALGPPPRRRAVDAAAPARSRLLASWGRDTRELQHVLAAAGPLVDHPLDPAPVPPTTLLGRLQADVRADAAAPGPPLPGATDRRPLLDPADRSLELHSCHGRARQVEVLRDAILHVLRERPELEPRDVIVLCPDIETFAPLIHATFGVGDAALGAGGEGARAAADADAPVPPDLRVRLADRAVRQTNPVLGTIGRLLELADARLTASEVLDLADRGPVRRRFAFDDDALGRLEDWTRRSGVRWGLDAPHRAPFMLTKVAAGTWGAGLDRVLLGVSMTEDDGALVGGVLPFDDVESGAIDLAGRFAELVERLRTTVDRFAVPHTIKGWAAELTRAADLLTAVAPRDAWQRSALDALLAGLVADAGVAAGGGADGAAGAGAEPPLLDLAELRALLADRLAGRPTRANFRTGHLTFCTLAPMRSVPHAVVCLLGLDDAVFPRRAPHDGDDLLLADPHVGDHDGRAEDRQLLLDAVLAAGEKLIVTYTGNDERTNAPKPPAVPVGELLDVVDRTVRIDAVPPRPAHTAIVVRHPLQPFDPRNFLPAAHAGGAPFSFDHVTLRGARALVAGRRPRPPFLAAPLPPRAGRVLALDDVVGFTAHPARAFLRQRLGIGSAGDADDPADALPIGLDPLEKWAVGDRMLAARLAGQELVPVLRAERARGTLPPGALANPILKELEDQVEAVAGAALLELERTADLDMCDVRIPLGDGRLLSGTVSGLDGDRLQTVVFSRLGPKHRLAAWVRLLALTAAHPERPFETVTIGRVRAGVRGGRQVSVARIPPLGADPAARRSVATACLAELLDLVDRGLRSAPVLPCRTAAAYAAAVADGADPVKAVTAEWESGWAGRVRISREDEEPEHQRLLGGTLTPAELLAIAPTADERGPGWDTDHGSRLGRSALRLWRPLLDVEELTDR